jgi:hypothetical protein
VTRSKYLIAAIVVASCLGVSSAMAQPMDQRPTVQNPATANVYVPPPELSGQSDARSPDAIDAAEGRLPGALPGPPQWPANPNAIVHASADDGGAPWLEIGLGLGGVVLLAGSGVAIRLTRRTRRPVG